MRTSAFPQARNRRRGYSLADTLIACFILGLGAMAATSLTLSMNTQEDIAWRVSRGANLVENAATLYGLGMDAADIPALLPTDAAVALTAGSESTETISGLNLRAADFTVTITTVEDLGSWTPGTWTGGSDGAARTRTISVRAYRSSHQLRMDQ